MAMNRAERNMMRAATATIDALTADVARIEVLARMTTPELRKFARTHYSTISKLSRRADLMRALIKATAPDND